MTASATTSRKSGAREGGGNACRSPRHHRHRHPRKPPLPGGRQASPPLPASYLCHCLQPPNGAHTSGHLTPPPSPPFRYNASTHAARASSQAASSASPSARRPRTQSPLAPPHRQPPPPAAPPPALLRPGRATPPPPPRRLKNPPATLTKALGRRPIGGESRHVDCVVKIGAAAPNAPAPTVSARGGGRCRRLSRRRRFRRRPPRVDDNFNALPPASVTCPPQRRVVGGRRAPRAYHCRPHVHPRHPHRQAATTGASAHSRPLMRGGSSGAPAPPPSRGEGTGANAASAAAVPAALASAQTARSDRSAAAVGRRGGDGGHTAAATGRAPAGLPPPQPPRAPGGGRDVPVSAAGKNWQKARSPSPTAARTCVH